MIEIGLRPFADPTARDAPGRPILVASSGIAHRRSVRNRAQSLPDQVLKRRAGHPQWHLEIAQLSAKIGLQLLADRPKRGIIPPATRLPGRSPGLPRCSTM